MLNVKVVTERIFSRVHTGGEEMKNDLPNCVERFIAAEGWKQVIDPSTGKPFENVGQWLVASYPLGPGMGKSRYSITYDEFIVLCEDRTKLKDLLIRFRPKGKRGGNGSNRYTGGKTAESSEKQADSRNPDNISISRKDYGTSKRYIEERLQRDHPEIWKKYQEKKYRSARRAGIAAGFIIDSEREEFEDELKTKFPKFWADYESGKYRSVRQAAIAAGITVDTHAPLMRLKTNWRKATRKERRDFLRWIKSGGGDQ
jgi:hypothetical protein